jgi:hypothetical protein
VVQELALVLMLFNCLLQAQLEVGEEPLELFLCLFLLEQLRQELHWQSEEQYLLVFE